MLVLRCDDRISYHIIRAEGAGLSKDGVAEALTVGLVVEGSIVIPHLRRAFEPVDGFWSS